MAATNRLHVITGGPGSGKSTLIAALAAAGVATSAEVGRQVIREQVALGGTALPWADELAFANAMAPREVAAHAARWRSATRWCSIAAPPMWSGFLHVSGLRVPSPIDAAARVARYNPRVFLAPFWAEIYAPDAERRQAAAVAAATEAVMRDTYAGYGYTIVELPRMSVADRLAFVLAAL